ncbi:hypothetical protein KIN20_038204 [Parelaphostrongylus tenuis]|uniref:Uncharacterized protein n=1 Tax=Parelaphostrongylus tenuis TaxID=148309 RepID=A0AAD5RF54_PARTN|nr:hypothetical protein KIN20_038204 [Parelaphostrongylus tenuis]
MLISHRCEIRFVVIAKRSFIQRNHGASVEQQDEQLNEILDLDDAEEQVIKEDIVTATALLVSKCLENVALIRSIKN